MKDLPHLHYPAFISRFHEMLKHVQHDVHVLRLANFVIDGVHKKIFLLVCIFLIFSCKENPKTYNGFSKKNNYYYKLLALGDGFSKTDSTQFVWIQACCKNLKDSIFWDTKHTSGASFFITKKSSSLLKNVYGFSAGDSLQYLFPVKEFFQEFFKSRVPFFCQKDSCVKFSVKIIRALSKDQFKQFNDSLQLQTYQLENKEQVQIKNYISTYCKQVIEFVPNAFIEITQTTKLDSVKKGKKIKLLYKGYFLDGTLVDYTPHNWAFELVCGQEGQLLTGLQLALYKLKKGEKAKIILPSQLAFGKQGSSNKNVPPYTPLVYQIEIEDVK